MTFRTRTFASLILTLAVPGLAMGCMARSAEDDFRAAVPRAEELRVEVPGEGEAPEGAATAALIGERSAMYQITRDTSRMVNGGTWLVLSLVRAIVEHRPTSIDGDHATWGPWTDTLSPLTYVLHVQRVEEGRYRYVLSGKPRAAGDEAFVDLIAGESELEHGRLLRGGVAIDFDAAHALDPYEHKHVGQIGVLFDISGATRSVEAAFDQVAGTDAEPRVSALYRYIENADGSGSFEFGVRADMDDPGAAAEDLVIMSRWDATGAGRGDAVATNGDLAGAVVYGSECWDGAFGRTFWYDNIGMIPTEGDAATCVYSEPLWSSM